MVMFNKFFAYLPSISGKRYAMSRTFPMGYNPTSTRWPTDRRHDSVHGTRAGCRSAIGDLGFPGLTRLLRYWL